MPPDKAPRRFALVNPDEPRSGDFAYGLYEKAHPIRGDAETIAYYKKALKGLRGRRVKLTFNGKRVDPESGKERNFRVQRTFQFRKYSDVFGSGSAYASAIHVIRDAHSDEELAVLSISIEEADDSDDDEDE